MTVTSHIDVLGPRLAMTQPEPSAGPEGQTLREAWSNWWNERSQLASVQPVHSIWSHYVTRPVASKIDEVPESKRDAVCRMLEEFLDAFHSRGGYANQSLHVTFPEDESVLVEWTFPDRRFGVSFEKNEQESGWYFVMSQGSSTRYEAGSMDQLDMNRMIQLTLQL